MVLLNCERCGKETHFLEPCHPCGRRVCRACQKSGKLLSTHERRLICKDCWTKMDKRMAFKRA
ncbi:MAG: hypothetical protein NTY90_03245 [Candidatus Micrarchaeota archaeon]|nr:hypothetical protein [Candidatus Micrarchaeota archaeon]